MARRRAVLAGGLLLLARPPTAQMAAAQTRAAPAPAGAAVAIPPLPPEMARAALAAVARFLLGRGGPLQPADGGRGVSQEELDTALAEVEVARQIADVYELADMHLALAAYDAVARFAPLTRERAFEFEALVTNSGRIFPALNAATDAIDRAYPAAREGRARRAVLADPGRSLDPALPLPVLVAAAVARAASRPPFAALEIMERCGDPGAPRPLAPPQLTPSLSRAMLTALGLAAPDLYEFYLHNFGEAAGPEARAAFIRNIRSAAARCLQR